ncbi:hypothetical protein HYT02_02505 [Candidatus Gottesmanbacteria bacterium]|nr:hypothetical protein [Candidatus Gottesmanbacteria bacterium]
MELELITSQVVGLSNDFLWSQTMVEGNFIATIEMQGDGFTPIKEEASVFLTGLVELVNRHKPQEKEAFRRIVAGYIENSPYRMKLKSLVVGLRNVNNLFLYCYKNGAAILKRGDLWSEIVKGDGLAVGTVIENDLLVLTTEAFEKLIPHSGVIDRFIKEGDPQIAGERIGAALHNFDDSKGAAAIFAYFKKTEIPITSLNVEVVPENSISPKPSISEKLTAVEMTHLKEVSGQPQVVAPSPSIISRVKAIFPQKTPVIDKPGISLNASPIKLVVTTPKKRVLVIALVLIGLLGASFFVVGDKVSNPSNSKVSAQLESITFRIEEGEALSDLNTLRAKISLTSAERELVSFIETLKKGTKERIEAEALLTRARQALGTVSKSYHVSPNIFADLTVVKPGAHGDGIAIYEGDIAVLDKTNTSIMLVDASGSTEIVGGGADTPNPRNIAIHGSSIFTLTDKGLVRTETGSKRQQVIVSDIGEIANASDMVGYAGNVYVLDGGNKKIWKFAPSGNSFTTARPYLSENETIPLNVVKMAIDGSVWILGENRVKKYVRGNEEFITIEGVDNPLVNAIDIFIDDLSKYLYIYDAGTNRVVVLDTDGRYNSEYFVDAVSGITDMVVSEDQGKIFLLSGSLIYSIDIHAEAEDAL